MFPNLNRIGWDCRIDEDGTYHPAGAIEHFPGGVTTWVDGKKTVRVTCQLCHPEWSGREKPDPECEACEGTGMREYRERVGIVSP